LWCEKMRFWKTKNPDVVVTEDLILRSVIRCPLKEAVKSRARLKRDVKIVRGQTNRLWPYTDVSAAVMVLNSARQGPPSAIVNFHTKQDGMSPAWVGRSVASVCLFVCLFVRAIK